MTKSEMLTKLKNYKGVGVEVVTTSGNKVCYFYENMTDSKGIDRAMKQIYPMMNKGKFTQVTFVS